LTEKTRLLSLGSVLTSQTAKMDVEELEVHLVVDENLVSKTKDIPPNSQLCGSPADLFPRLATLQVASIQTKLLPQAVPRSTKAPKRDPPLTMSPNPHVKRKLHSMTLRSESRRASEDAPVSSSSPLSSLSSSFIADGRPITRDDPSLTGKFSIFILVYISSRVLNSV
jgi:hypothetical protein